MTAWIIKNVDCSMVRYKNLLNTMDVRINLTENKKLKNHERC